MSPHAGAALAALPRLTARRRRARPHGARRHLPLSVYYPGALTYWGGDPSRPALLRSQINLATVGRLKVACR